MTATIDTRSNQAMLDLFHQTFMVDKRPRCHQDGGCGYAPKLAGQVGCAIGVALDPEDRPEWDRCGAIGDIQTEHAEMFGKYFDQDQAEFLRGLQHLHDNALASGPDSDDLRDALSDLAAEHGLNDPQVTE